MCSLAKSPEAKLRKKLQYNSWLLEKAAPKPLSTDLSAHQNKAAYQTPSISRSPRNMMKTNTRQKDNKNTITFILAEGGLRCPRAGGPLSLTDCIKKWKRKSVIAKSVKAQEHKSVKPVDSDRQADGQTNRQTDGVLNFLERYLITTPSGFDIKIRLNIYCAMV